MVGAAQSCDALLAYERDAFGMEKPLSGSLEGPSGFVLARVGSFGPQWAPAVLVDTPTKLPLAQIHHKSVSLQSARVKSYYLMVPALQRHSGPPGSGMATRPRVAMVL